MQCINNHFSNCINIVFVYLFANRCLSPHPFCFPFHHTFLYLRSSFYGLFCGWMNVFLFIYFNTTYNWKVRNAFKKGITDSKHVVHKNDHQTIEVIFYMNLGVSCCNFDIGVSFLYGFFLFSDGRLSPDIMMTMMMEIIFNIYE